MVIFNHRSYSTLFHEHKACCEVFAEAAWEFFRKEPSKYEVINDLDSDLICFYRVLQNHLEEFKISLNGCSPHGNGSRIGKPIANSALSVLSNICGHNLGTI